MRWKLAATLAALTLACGSPAEPGEGGGLLRVQPLAPAYAAGAAAGHRITNLTPSTLQFSPCSGRLEKESPDGGWVLAYQETAPCPVVLEHLHPWASRTVKVAVPGDPPSGMYRVRFPSAAHRSATGSSLADQASTSGGTMEFAHVVLARVYEHIGPIDRGDRYEDPLQSVLEKAVLGRVTGGGSQLNELGGIDYADVEIELANLGEALDLVVETLEQAGAPQGSELLHLTEDRVLREFGRQQCLAIFLDGTSLPDEVYADLDFDAVVDEIGSAAGENSYRGFWQGPEETGIFFFGPDAGAMLARVEPVLRRLPIGQNARVVVRHGKASSNPHEIRMPRH